MTMIIDDSLQPVKKKFFREPYRFYTGFAKHFRKHYSSKLKIYADVYLYSINPCCLSSSQFPCCSKTLLVMESD